MISLAAVKSRFQVLLTHVSRAIVARGLRPESAALLGYGSRQQDVRETENETQRLAAQWIMRQAMPPEVAALLLDSSATGGATGKGGHEMHPASRQWAYWLARECTAIDMTGALRMPLVESVNSSLNQAIFFDGENIQVMQGGIVSGDSRIGANTYVGFNCHITKARIGRYVSIADNVLVGPGEHRLDRVSTHSIFYDAPYETLTEAACVIQDDVWIGASCIIRRGVTIGTGAVIGANSFVNQDVPPFAIMAGSPARNIGARFDDQTAAKILASKWWELPASEARKLIEQLTQEISS